jgi:hypothetical protein
MRVTAGHVRHRGVITAIEQDPATATLAPALGRWHHLAAVRRHHPLYQERAALQRWGAGRCQRVLSLPAGAGPAAMRRRSTTHQPKRIKRTAPSKPIKAPIMSVLTLRRPTIFQSSQRAPKTVPESRSRAHAARRPPYLFQRLSANATPASAPSSACRPQCAIARLGAASASGAARSAQRRQARSRVSNGAKSAALQISGPKV